MNQSENQITCESITGIRSSSNMEISGFSRWLTNKVVFRRHLNKLQSANYELRSEVKKNLLKKLLTSAKQQHVLASQRFFVTSPTGQTSTLSVCSEKQKGVISTVSCT